MPAIWILRKKTTWILRKKNNTIILSPNDNKRCLTLVKVGGPNYKPSSKDLQDISDMLNGITKWNTSLINKADISSEEIDIGGNDHQLIIVRVGGENYLPTENDLEYFRDIFKEAAKHKEFTIFTHSNVNIDVINLKNNKIVVY